MAIIGKILVLMVKYWLLMVKYWRRMVKHWLSDGEVLASGWVNYV